MRSGPRSTRSNPVFLKNSSYRASPAQKPFGPLSPALKLKTVTGGGIRPITVHVAFLKHFPCLKSSWMHSISSVDNPRYQVFVLTPSHHKVTIRNVALTFWPFPILTKINTKFQNPYPPPSCLSYSNRLQIQVWSSTQQYFVRLICKWSTWALEEGQISCARARDSLERYNVRSKHPNSKSVNSSLYHYP